MRAYSQSRKLLLPIQRHSNWSAAKASKSNTVINTGHMSTASSKTCLPKMMLLIVPHVSFPFSWIARSLLLHVFTPVPLFRPMAELAAMPCHRCILISKLDTFKSACIRHRSLHRSLKCVRVSTINFCHKLWVKVIMDFARAAAH